MQAPGADAFETAPVALAELDSNAEVVRANERFVRTHPDLHVGSSVLELFHEEDRATLLELLDPHSPAAENGVSVTALRQVDGDPVQVGRLRSSEDGPVAAIHLGSDGGARDTPLDFGRLCRLMRKLLLSVSDTITVLDAAGRVTTTTGTGKPVLGYPPEWWAGRSITDLAHPDDMEQGAQMLARVLEHPGEEFDTEVRVKHADGHYEWIELNAINQLEDPDVGGIVVTTRNVSFRKRTEEELTSSRDSALALAEAKSDYVAMVSHEIRAPLHSILGFAELLENRLDSPAEREPGEWATRIRDEAGRLARLIEDLLDLSRLDTGRAEMKSEPFHLRGLLEDVMELARFSADEQGLELNPSIDPTVTDWRSGDRDRIHQVLLNLVNNAIKFTTEGRVDLEVSPLAERGSGEWVRFAITDTGPGIPADEIERVFEPFRQVASSDASSGSGLGLAISSKLVEAMGGEKLSVSSLEGHGSTFHFCIPLPFTKEPETGRDRAAAGPAPGLHVLVVDDNPTNRMLVEAQLIRLGCTCEVAADGSEALARLDSPGIDVVLMDCNMPVMDGFEATRRIRSSELGTSRRLPVLALTASAVAATRDACQRAGMDGFLAKPIALSDLADGLAPFSSHRSEPGPAHTPGAPDANVDLLDHHWIDQMIDDVGLESMRKVAQTYLSEAPGRLADIDRHASEGDVDATRRSVHALRSPSAMLGASALADLLHDIEYADDPVSAATSVELGTVLEESTRLLLERIGSDGSVEVP